MLSRQKDVQNVRQASYTALLVDSMDRYPNGYPDDVLTQTTSSEWTLQASQYVLNGYFTRLALTQIQFFWNLPTVIVGYNNRYGFFFNILGFIPITIPTGWYSPDTLAQAILDYSTGTFGPPITGFTCVANPTTGILTFGYSDRFYLLSPTVAANEATSRTIPANIYARSYQTAGAIPGEAFAVSGGRFELSGTLPTMLATRFINLESKYLTKHQRVKDSSTLLSGQSTNILCRINAFAPSTRTPWPPLVPETPFVISIEYSTAKLINWSPDEIVSNFDISLTDEYGQLVPWDSSFGCEYSFNIIASEV